jgi:Acetyl xylan esterase (AXE1)
MNSARCTLCRSTIFALFLTSATCAGGQAIKETVEPLLKDPVQPTGVTAFQLQEYMMKRTVKPVPPATAEDWSAEAQKLRKHILEDVAFHGWPREWVNSTPHFEQTGLIETPYGYRLRKYRYEIVPGFQSTAILYEPEKLAGRVPAILNLVGHDVEGNLVEYEQKQGMLALSLGWPGFGELDLAENSHDFGGHLDLVGSNALGFFYLLMRRGLDYLETLPQVDPQRIGVTGLSGGGWQTITLSALDERVSAMVEVAGFGSYETNLTRPMDTQEVEEDATDLIKGFDYPFLVAMRAPRPTLLIHNQQDDCCFLAPFVKPYVFDQVQPFFRLYHAEKALRWYENVDPGTHNYQLDNRQQAYAFFAEVFHLPTVTKEIPSDSEIQMRQELKGDLPKDNLTTSGLARKLAAQIQRGPVPTAAGEREKWVKAQRALLRSVVRYSPVTVEGAWKLISTKKPGLQSLSYRFDLSNALCATGIWVAGSATASGAPLTIVLNDKGYKFSAATVAERVNRGEQVLTLDLLFFGATNPNDPEPAYWEMLVASSGDRPLGIEAAQLIAVAKFFREQTGPHPIRIETEGIRSQVAALVAAALEPELFSEIRSNGAMNSLSYLLDTPVPYRNAPDLFCLDLYKEFDLDRLAVLASAVKIALASKAGPLPPPKTP